MYVNFDELGDDARVWIFQSPEFLEFEKTEPLSGRFLNFLDGWQAHGNPLKASFKLMYNRFVIIALDEASYQATGCSIDKLTHLVQDLEREMQLSLLDRTQIAYRDTDNGMIDTMHMMNFRAALESGDLDQDSTVFNNLIETKEQLSNQWETAVKNSWHRQWLPVA